MPAKKLESEFTTLHTKTTRLLSTYPFESGMASLHRMDVINFISRAEAVELTHLVESAKNDSADLQVAISRHDLLRDSH